MFKKSILSLLFVLILTACGLKGTPAQPTPSADLEEQAVYAALLKDIYGAPMYVIMESTATDPGGVGDTAARVDYVLQNLRDVDKAVGESFKSRNDKAYPVLPDMELGVEYVVLTQAQRNEMFNQNTSGWETFYKNYPSAPGITELSRAGFSKSFDQALVYVGTQSHYLAGAGYYVLLVKSNGAWTVSQKVMTWIS